MKGTDLSQWELDAAEDFIRGRARGVVPPEGSIGIQIALPWEDFVRIVAWYGAIRAEGVAKGGDPREPGHVAVKGLEVQG